jgi:hypothetical protein
MARSGSDSANDYSHEVLSEDDHHYNNNKTTTTLTVTKKAETAEWEDEWKRLAARESQVIAYARVIVLIVLLCATAVVTLGMRSYIRSDQRDDFAAAFVAAADKILESFHHSVQRRLEAGMSFMIFSCGFINICSNMNIYYHCSLSLSRQSTLCPWP